MRSFITLSLAGLLAVANAAPHSKRCGCNGPDPSVVDTIYKVGKSLGVTHQIMISGFETCLQESGCCDLPCGNLDSIGAFQQRPSQGWGTYAQIMDVGHSANSFFQQAIPIGREHPNEDPGVIAQDVQDSSAGELYSQHYSQAIQLINEAAGRTGIPWDGSNGGASNVGAAPKAPTKPKPKSKPKPKATSTKHSSPPESTSSTHDAGGIKDCAEDYRPKAGDDCDFVVSMFPGLTLEEFYDLNKEIDSECHNLQIGKAYCVKAA